MASPTQWTWVWVNSRSWSWTGRPGVLQFMGLQRVGQDWVTELNWAVSWIQYVLVCLRIIEVYSFLCRSASSEKLFPPCGVVLCTLYIKDFPWMLVILVSLTFLPLNVCDDQPGFCVRGSLGSDIFGYFLLSWSNFSETGSFSLLSGDG